MSYLEIEPTFVRAEPSGFDTRRRYIRKSVSGSIVFSGGRTIRTYGSVKHYASSTVSFSWIPFRVDIGAFTYVGETITHSGHTDTAAVTPVSPTLENCTI